MTTLKVLADARQEILKAEVAALLHNLGKLNNTFILHSAEDAPSDSKYHFERIIQPQWVISIRQAEIEIRSLASFDLALKLLSDLDWGTLVTAATTIRAALEQRATTGSPPAGADGMRRWLFVAIEGISDAESALSVLCAVYGACKLHDLLLETPSPDQRYPYEQLPRDDIQFLLDTRVNIGSEYTLGELITLMWDEFHIRDRKPTDTGDPITDERSRIHNEYSRRDALSRWIGKPTFLPRYLITSHGSVSGLKGGVSKQLKGYVFSASAYGCEASKVPSLDALCLELLRKLSSAIDKIGVSVELENTVAGYQELTNLVGNSLRQALGDTRRPDNDITLQDYSASIAALYKASVAQAILEDHFVETNELRWRLLHVSFDGLAFWGQAHHVTDMLGRRQVLEDGLNAVRDILEVKYPLGNEVYCDEHGSVFVVPDVGNLLELKDEDSESLKKLLEDDFNDAGVQGELVPEIKVSDPYLGKKIDLAGTLQSRRRKNVPRPDVVARWWAKGQRPENAEICTVCGQRPVGYVEPGLEKWVTSQKAKDRNVCGICLHRRGRRAQDWARNVKAGEEKIGPFERTIWTDEVADDNGRFALVVGRFNLEGWLDGKLIPTMLKSPSFARIRRCWDTTRQFWLEVQDEVIPGEVGERERLGIRPTNAPVIRKTLGRWHTYEAEVGGRRLGLCWDPNNKGANDRDLFWTTDNLNYLAAQLGITVEKLEERLGVPILPLYEPGGYLGQERRVEKDAEECMVVQRAKFLPFIPLLVEPATFMALVPADKALEVAKAIKKKYDREMARVRDRLPLHLGLVFAPRRTPLAAVLEAGRAMLEMPDGWEEWQVAEKWHWQAENGKWRLSTADGHTVEEDIPQQFSDNPAFQEGIRLVLTAPRRGINPPAEQLKGAEAPPASRLQPALAAQPDDSSSGDGTAWVVWHYPRLMGDGQTPDVWYPHLLLDEPNERLREKEEREMVPQGEEPRLKKEDGDFCPVDDLTGTVFIRPSRFDFVFLDTTARRFEIHYASPPPLGEGPEVRARRTRPFLLDDLDRLETLWKEMCRLEKSQRYQIISIIEATREAWFGDDREGESWSNGVFRQFVRDTLAGAAWPKDHKWHDIEKSLRKQLENAGVTGELADLAELHIQILKE